MVIETQNTMTKFSNRNSNETVKGPFFVTYSAINSITGKEYTTTHLNPCGPNDLRATTSADELQAKWSKIHGGRCPFNGDEGFNIVRIQQRYK